MSFYELFLEVEYWKGEKLTSHEAAPVILRDLAKKNSNYYVVEVETPDATRIKPNSIATPIRRAIDLVGEGIFTTPYLAIIKFSPLFFHTVIDLRRPPNTFWLKHLYWNDLIKFLEKNNQAAVGSLKKDFNKLWEIGNPVKMANFIRDVLDDLPQLIKRKALKAMDIKAFASDSPYYPGSLMLYNPDPRYIKIIKIIPRGTELSLQIYQQGFRQKPTEIVHIVNSILTRYGPAVQQMYYRPHRSWHSKEFAEDTTRNFNSLLKKIMDLKQRQDHKEIIDSLREALLYPLSEIHFELTEGIEHAILHPEEYNKKSPGSVERVKALFNVTQRLLQELGSKSKAVWTALK